MLHIKRNKFLFCMICLFTKVARVLCGRGATHPTKCLEKLLQNNIFTMPLRLDTIIWKFKYLPRLLDFTGVQFLRTVLPRLVVDVGVSKIRGKSLNKYFDKI